MAKEDVPAWRMKIFRSISLKAKLRVHRSGVNANRSRSDGFNPPPPNAAGVGHFGSRGVKSPKSRRFTAASTRTLPSVSDIPRRRESHEIANTLRQRRFIEHHLL
ncbi:MAG: hypothetical protein QNJ04_16630, partial [Desulfobacterales bacterium]|nr:hypothetical protein [Desulfobacterales bacterium]